MSQREKALTGEKVTRVLIAIIAVILVVLALRLTADVTMPLAFALFIVILVAPIERWLERYLPRRLAITLTLLGMFGVVALFVGGLVMCVNLVAEEAPKYRDALESAQRTLERWTASAGIERRFELSQLASPEMARRLGVAVAHVAGIAVLVIGFAVLALLEVDRWRRKLDHGPDGRAHQLGSEITHKFHTYVWTKTVISAISGVFTWLYATALGLDLALLWGFTAFLLNYIPNVGSVVAFIPPSILAFIQFDSTLRALAIPAGLGTVDLVLGNYIEPRLQGKTLDLSSVVVLFSIVFWTWIWGLPGAVIGVPITVALALTCDAFESTKWIATLLLHQPRESLGSPESPESSD